MLCGLKLEISRKVKEMKIWQCSVCGYLYDEAKGDPDHGIAPGTPWSEVPEDFECPECGVAKSSFAMVEL